MTNLKHLSLLIILTSLPTLSLSCSSTAKKPDASQPKPQASAPAAQVSQPVAKTVPHHTVKKGQDGMMCRLNEDERTAKIQPKGPGCEVEYSKFGKSSVIASSAEGQKHCEDALEKIRKNLITAGFACQ